MGACAGKPTVAVEEKVNEKGNEKGNGKVNEKVNEKVKENKKPKEIENETKAENGGTNQVKKGNQIAPEPKAKAKEETVAKVTATGSNSSRRRSSTGVAADAETFLKINKSRLQQTRTVRVFISSTFRDFALERDYLMRHALPQLRKYGESRGVTVVFVDLRWGVTSEESSGGAVVKLCLQEIDACRPFFVGMLGERYGWHLAPDRKDELLENTMDIGEAKYPWVQLYRDRSVTELEMLHGALMQPDLAEFVTFYFRQHEEFKKRMSDQISEEDRPSYEAESSHAKKGQDRLKDEIRAKFKDNCFEYSHVKELSETLVKDISRAIEAEFPMDTNSFDFFDSVNLQHEAFAASRRMGYVPLPQGFGKINDFVKSCKSAAVTGFSGLGKSALLANWVTQYIQDHPETIVFTHFVGCTTESTDHYHIIRRLLAHFCKEMELDVNDFLDDSEKLRTKPHVDENGNETWTGNSPTAAAILSLNEEKLIEIVGDFLALAVKKAKEMQKQIVIVLDGLDQLEDKANAHTLFWMPEVPGLQYVCSIKKSVVEMPRLDKRPTEARLSDIVAENDKEKMTKVKEDYEKKRKLSKPVNFTSKNLKHVASDDEMNASTAARYWKQRGWESFGIDELELNEQRQVIVKYLAEHAKKLDPTQINMVLAADTAQNPLFLRTLLDEARLFGNFFQLTDHLKMLLEAKTNPDLYRMILERMGSECGQDLMRWSVGIVLCARDGITDQELRQVLQQEEESDSDATYYEGTNLKPYTLENDADVRLLVQLLFGLREQLCSTSGFLRFFHDAAKEAVTAEIGDVEHGSMLLHRRLASYFGKSLKGDGSSDKNSADNDKNDDSLCDEEKEAFLARQLRELPFHLSASQQYVELAAFLSQQHVLEEMLSDESKKYEFVKYWREIEASWREVHPKYEKQKNNKVLDPKTSRPINSVEIYLLTVVDEAKEGITLDLKSLEPDQVISMKERIRIAALIMDHVSTLLVLLSLYDGAVATRQDEITFNTIVFGSVHDKISVSCSELADVYERVYCKYDVSMKLKSRAVNIDRQLYGEENRQLAVGYDNLALLHLKLGNYNDAEEMYHKSLTIKEKVCGEQHRDVAQTVCSLGLLMEELGKFEEAKKWYQRGLDIRTKTFGPSHPSVARSAIDMGMLLLKTSQSSSAAVRESALPLVQGGLENLQGALGPGHTDVAAAANNLGLVYSALEEFSIALKYHLQAKKIQVNRLGEDHPAYAATCTNIGSVCQELADESFRNRKVEEEEEYFITSEDHYSRAILIYRVKVGEEHPELATTLQNLGTLYFDSVSRDASRIHDLQDELKGATSDAAKEPILADIEDVKPKIRDSLEQAVTNFQEALKIREAVFGASHSSTLSSKDSLSVAQERLDRFDSSGGEDFDVAEGESGEDMVDVCANDLSKLLEIVRDVYQLKLGGVSATISLKDVVKFNQVLDKIAQEIAIELPTDSDVEKAIKSLEDDSITVDSSFDAEALSKIVQKILIQVYL